MLILPKVSESLTNLIFLLTMATLRFGPHRETFTAGEDISET